MARPLTSTDAHPKGAHDRRLGRLNDRILDAFALLESGTPADQALKATFKKARDLGSKERAHVADVFYGMIRKRRLIEDRLRRAAKAEKKRFDDLDRPIQHRLLLLGQQLLSGESLDALKARDAYAFKRIPNLFKRIQNNKLASSKRSELEELAISLSLPSFMVERLVSTIGEDKTKAMAQALSGRAPLTLRVNQLCGTREEARARIQEEAGVEATPTKLSPWGLILPHPVDLNTWPLYKEGWLEPQDEGSQLIAMAMNAKPDESILDACAGAGGKTLAIAAQMKNRGRLVAIDPEAKKTKELSRRLKQAGATAEPKKADLMALETSFRGSFDAALVDAPCTGSGVLRRNPDILWRTSESSLLEEIGRQKRLLASALTALRPGGRLVYATCSVLQEENEDIIKYLFEHTRGLEGRPLQSSWGPQICERMGLDAAAFMARIGPGPGPSDPDGFFVASMQLKA